jgi:hypothetical protein
MMRREDFTKKKKHGLNANEENPSFPSGYTYRSGKPTKRQNKVESNRWATKERSKPKGM